MNNMFSVIVPIYKVEKYLKKCVDSILAQTYTDFELILVDDGSPDNCPAICDDYKDKDNRVMVIHKDNGGLVSARNTGLLAAKGEYICYVDGDDWIAKDLLKTVFEKGIESYKPDMVVYGAVRQFENEHINIPNDIEEGIYNKEKLQKDIYPYMMYDNRKSFCNGLIFPVAWNKVYKRELLVKHYCKDERIRMGEDNAFVFECVYEAENIYFCQDILYYYNQLNNGSMTNNYDENRFENNQYLTEYIENRMGGKDEVMDGQINAFKAYWLIMAVFHEMKCGKTISRGRKHIKEKIKKTKVTSGIAIKGLPVTAKGFLILLKMHMYSVALLGAKIISKKDKG